MNKNIKTILMFAGFAVLIYTATFVYNNLIERMETQHNTSIQGDESKTSSDAEEKIEAPDFTMLDADGNEVRLSELFGKPIVLNFWASWCPPCKEEMPDFDLVYGELGNDVTFLMVNLTDGKRETIDIAKKYISKQGFSFPVYFDTEQEAAYQYGIRSIPTTIFIDKDGIIIAGVQGAIDEQTLRQGIQLLQP